MRARWRKSDYNGSLLNASRAVRRTGPSRGATMPDQPIARTGYDQLADAYAAQVATKPHNAFYDRPALLALLPAVAHRQVLDAGCGSGIYTEWLVNHGATVLALDASPKMVAHAQARLQDR